MTLADRLQRVLDARGCTVAEASRLSGVDPQMIHRIIWGTNDNPKLKTLERIVVAIGATLAELFQESEEAQ
jgi:transcriptional regulator with XRE-family HTH domain